MSEEDQQTPESPKKEAEDAPSAPAPTIPLKPASEAPKAPAPAPTIPLKPAAGGSAPAAPAAPAPTVQLTVPGAAPKTTPLKTQPLAPGGDSDATQELPKATVQLGSATQALGAPTALSPGGPIASLHTEPDPEPPSTVANILSIAAFVIALGVLGLQFYTFSKWANEEDPVDGPGWNALIE